MWCNCWRCADGCVNSWARNPHPLLFLFTSAHSSCCDHAQRNQAAHYLFVSSFYNCYFAHMQFFFRGKLFCILRNRNWCLVAGVITVKTTAHWVWNSRMRFFRILHPFLLKWMLQMRKRRKSNLMRIFCNGQKFRRQCVKVIVTTWGRIYFSTCEKFRTTILDSVCRDLNSVSFAVCLWGEPHYVWHNLTITPIDLNSSKESIIQTWNWWTLKFVAQIMLKLWI